VWFYTINPKKPVGREQGGRGEFAKKSRETPSRNASVAAGKTARQPTTEYSHGSVILKEIRFDLKKKSVSANLSVKELKNRVNLGPEKR